MSKQLFLRGVVLIIALTTVACSKSRNNPDPEIPQFSKHTFPGLDFSFLRIYHVQGDSVISYDPTHNLLYKISLITQEADTIPIELRENFQATNIYYISADSILFSKGSQFLLYQKNGEIQKKFNLFSALSGIEKEVYSEYPYDGIANHLLYVPARKSVLFYFAKAEVGKKRVFAEYSLESEAWKSLPVYHPQSLQGVKLNYTTFPSVTLTPDGFSFIYSISPGVVGYSWGDSQQQEKTVSSFEGRQEAEPQTNRDDWSGEYFENWVLQSPNYLKLIFDSYRNVYYRISQEALNRSPGGGQDYYEFLIQNRQMYLTVLDLDFEVLANYPLEKSKYDPKHAFVFSQGLWIPYDAEFLESEEGLEGDLFTFQN